MTVVMLLGQAICNKKRTMETSNTYGQVFMEV